VWQASETELEKKKREADAKRDEKKARNKKIRKDWRTNRLEGTRNDTDFINMIQDIGIGDNYKNPQQKAAEAKRAGPYLFPDYIGPKVRVIDYEVVDKISFAKTMALGTTVSEQVSPPRSERASAFEWGDG